LNTSLDIISTKQKKESAMKKTLVSEEERIKIMIVEDNVEVA